MLSRNFRLQRVGDLNWLNENYDFAQISAFIDELVVLDVTRGARNQEKFASTLRDLSSSCFVPISAGGGVNSINTAKMLFLSGADKVVINSALFGNLFEVEQVSREFGQQSIVASLDLSRNMSGGYLVKTENGTKPQSFQNLDSQSWMKKNLVGELYINSIDKDGTGQGFDLGMLDWLPKNLEIPVIIAGGVGNAAHFLEGLLDERVDAVATANLFNFVGNGLEIARKSLISNGEVLATWLPMEELKKSIQLS